MPDLLARVEEEIRRQEARRMTYDRLKPILIALAVGALFFAMAFTRWNPLEVQVPPQQEQAAEPVP